MPAASVSQRPHRRARLVLSAADHEHFLEHGFVVVKRALSPARLARTLSELDAGIRVSGSPTEAERERLTPVLTASVRGKIRRAVAELTAGLGAPHPDLVSLTLQSRPYEPNQEWSARTTHVDGDYPTLMPNFLALGALLFLTRVESRGGALLYYPGSQRKYRAVMARSFAAPKNGLPDLPDLPGAETLGRPLEFLAEPGDTLIFHHLFAHAASRNCQDPGARHAILSWWRPERRVVPGARPASRMSTLEKANSARYLSKRFGVEPPLPDVAGDRPTVRVLAEGLPASGIRAHAVLHFGGMAHRFVVEGKAPAKVRLLRSRDLRDWREVACSIPEAPALGPIGSLAVFQWDLDVVLAVTHPDRIRIWGSRDLAEWTELGSHAAAASFAAPHFNRNAFNATRFAMGCVLFLSHPTDRRRLLCRWGSSWSDLSAGLRDAACAATGARMDDAVVAPVFGEYISGLVVDVASDPISPSPSTSTSTSAWGRQGGSRPMYALSDESAHYAGPLIPLRFSTPGPPRRIRVYARAEEYWMVGYVRAVNGANRFFWGGIDWSVRPARLVEIASARALQNAFFTLGMR